MTFVFDTGKDGLETIMKDYQAICMRYMWEVGEEGANSGKTWGHVSKELRKNDKTISRASIIFFMNDMVDIGALNFRSKSGKGGYHRVYFPIHDEKGFRGYVIRNILDKITETWPDEAEKVISEFSSSRPKE